MEYTYTIQFKDDKIRVLVPFLNKIRAGSNDVYVLGAKYGDGVGIFGKKDNELNLPFAKSSIEGLVNTIISNLVNELKSGKSNNW